MDQELTVVTYDGSSCGKLLEDSGLGARLESGLPLEAVEWKRSFGRTAKSVVIRAKLVRANQHFQSLTSNGGAGGASLLGVPVLHTFWTECPDLDTYKSVVKEEIGRWIAKLKQVWGSGAEWVIVLIEVPESTARKSSKLLLQRTSVLDKIKSDFASGAGGGINGGGGVSGVGTSNIGAGVKQFDKCLSLLDPSRNDSRASDSWQRLLHRFRISILQAYNRQLGRFEEGMRNQRERRNEASWNFCDYFLLQEELAFVYEMLGVFDESLLQYDELDALFTQFVANSNLSESPGWLSSFAGDFNSWSGVSLKNDGQINRCLRAKIISRNPSLLDVRNYLFSRQSLMLLKLGRPWEVAKRCLSFLHNVIQELAILEVGCEPEGSVSCWVFLSILEVVTTCEVKSKEAVARAVQQRAGGGGGEGGGGMDNNSQRSLSNAHVQQYCRYTAELWAYCRLRLLELGGLCGLMPKSNPSSQQIHLVVELSAGIQEEEGEGGEGYQRGGTSSADHLRKKEDSPTALIIKRKQHPVEKLKEALSSKQAFQKCYLELSEYAISTFKHIGRIRSARRVGLDLADFYLDLGQVQTAVTFLADALKTFQMDGWDRLRVMTLMKAAHCYQILEDHERLVKTTAQIICGGSGSGNGSQAANKMGIISAAAIGGQQHLVSPQERNLYFQKFSDGLRLSDSILKLSADGMLRISSCKITQPSPETDQQPETETADIAGASNLQRVISGSTLTLRLDIESFFPATIEATDIKVALGHTEFNSRLPESPPPPLQQGAAAFKGRKVGLASSNNSVQRTPSTRSNVSSLSSLSLVTGGGGGGGTSENWNSLQPLNHPLPAPHPPHRRDRKLSETSSVETDLRSTEAAVEDEAAGGSLEMDEGWSERLKLAEVRDVKQDGTLTAIRTVCKNVAHILRRKDSTGAFLSNTSQSPPSAAAAAAVTSQTPSSVTSPSSSNNVNNCDNKVSYDLSFQISSDQQPDSQQPVKLNPGTNRVYLTAKAGPETGSYTLQQMSVTAFHQKLQIIQDMNSLPIKTRTFQVISETPTIFLRQLESSQPLWSGINQTVLLDIYSGSFHFKKGSSFRIECGPGLVGGVGDDSDICSDTGDGQSSHQNANVEELHQDFDLSLPEVRPFSSGQVSITLLAALPNKCNAVEAISNKLRIANPCWTDEPVDLAVSFVNPFMISAQSCTASMGKKFLRFTVFSATGPDTDHSLHLPNSDNRLRLNNHRLSDLNGGGLTLKPLVPQDQVMNPTYEEGCDYIWQVDSTPEEKENSDGNETQQQPINKISVELEFDYRLENFGRGAKGAFSSKFDFDDIETLYEVRTRVDPMTGGELVRASSICALSITIRQLGSGATSTCTTNSASCNNQNLLMYEVNVGDQSEHWAVCGRSAGVINMDTAKRQTVVVEIMALAGGHLLLPRVDIMRYIPAATAASAAAGSSSNQAKSDQVQDAAAASRDAGQQSNNNPDSLIVTTTKSLPRTEKFAAGQVYWATSLDRVHVLPPLPNNAAGGGGMGGSFGVGGGGGSTMVLLSNKSAILQQDAMQKTPAAAAAEPVSLMFNAVVQGSTGFTAATAQQRSVFKSNQQKPNCDNIMDQHASMP